MSVGLLAVVVLVIGMSVGLLAVVVLVIAAAAAMFWPLLTAQPARARGRAGDVALEISRDAKLGELHDLELDFRLGKLSVEDYRTLNATVRAEAIELIRQIDASAANGKPVIPQTVASAANGKPVIPQTVASAANGKPARTRRRRR